MRLMTARSSGRRNKRGRGLPAQPEGVAEHHREELPKELADARIVRVSGRGPGRRLGQREIVATVDGKHSEAAGGTRFETRVGARTDGRGTEIVRRIEHQHE